MPLHLDNANELRTYSQAEAARSGLILEGTWQSTLTIDLKEPGSIITNGSDTSRLASPHDRGRLYVLAGQFSVRPGESPHAGSRCPECSFLGRKSGAEDRSDLPHLYAYHGARAFEEMRKGMPLPFIRLVLALCP